MVKMKGWSHYMLAVVLKITSGRARHVEDAHFGFGELPVEKDPELCYIC